MKEPIKPVRKYERPEKPKEPCKVYDKIIHFTPLSLSAYVDELRESGCGEDFVIEEVLRIYDSEALDVECADSWYDDSDNLDKDEIAANIDNFIDDLEEYNYINLAPAKYTFKNFYDKVLSVSHKNLLTDVFDGTLSTSNVPVGFDEIKICIEYDERCDPPEPYIVGRYETPNCFYEKETNEYSDKLEEYKKLYSLWKEDSKRYAVETKQYKEDKKKYDIFLKQKFKEFVAKERL